MLTPRIRTLRNRIAANVETKAEQLTKARELRAEWETFLAMNEFLFREDALSHETTSLEEAGFEEEDSRAIFGFEEDAVSSGIRVVCDEFYEEDSAEFMAG